MPGGEMAQEMIDLSKPAKYVGAKECKECHEAIYKGWQATFHPYKFKDVSPDVIIADFEKNNTLEAGGYTSTMIRRGSDFFVKTMGPDNKEHEYKIKYVIGGFWKQRYVTEFPDGALHVLPVQWNVKTLEWVDYHGLKKHKPGSGKYWSDSQRTYQYKCTGCHNTGSQINHNKQANTFETTWSDKGVSCEACHGPGSNHLAAPISQKAESIINPATMPDPRRAAMICGACHTRGKSADGKFGYPADYKPGAVLDFLYDHKPGLHPDGSAKKHHQQYNDWLTSDHATAGVQCWDCHNPHSKGASNRFQLKLPGNSLCNSCHQVEPTGVHGIHSVNNCIGCHLPNTAKSATPGDIPSHRFKVVMPALTEKNAKQPNSCNLCHYHKDDKPADLQAVLDSIKAKSKAKYSKAK